MTLVGFKERNITPAISIGSLEDCATYLMIGHRRDVLPMAQNTDGVPDHVDDFGFRKCIDEKRKDEHRFGKFPTPRGIRRYTC